MEVVVSEKDDPFPVGRLGAAPVLTAARRRVLRPRFLFGRFHVAAFDHGPGFLLRRLEHAQRRTGLIRHQPDMAGVRVLIVLRARCDGGVAAPLAVHVDPIDDDLARRLVLERDAGLAAGATGRTWPAAGGQRFHRCRSVGTRTQFVGVQVQTPSLIAAAQHNRLGVGLKLQPLDRQLFCRHVAAQQLAQCRSRTGVIESRLPHALLGVHQDEFASAVLQFVAIPEPGLVGKPVRDDLVAIDPRFARFSAGPESEQEH